MVISGFSWVGIRAQDFDKGVRFYEQLFDMQADLVGKDVARFKLPTGQVVELIGPSSPWAKLHDHPVVAFDVADIEAWRDRFLHDKVELTPDLHSNKDGGFLYFRGPDGVQYSLSQNTK